MDCNIENQTNHDSNSSVSIDQNDGIDSFADDKPESTVRKKTTTAAGVAAILAMLWKFKTILLLVLGKLKFLFVFLKLGKLALSFGSMLIMVAVETKRYGLPMAVGFVLLIFVHEIGHYLTARKSGLNVSMPIFIPFLGAFIAMKDMPKNVEIEARVAIAGPIVGSVGALICLGAYALTGSRMMLLLTYVGLILNIFNLIPINPLDGGRVISALSPKMWIVGIVMMTASAIYFKSPIMVFILILGIIQAISYWKNPQTDYFTIDREKRIMFAVAYFALVVILGAGSFEIYKIFEAGR